MASSFIKVSATEPTACERWGCDRTIQPGDAHHTDTRTGRHYCLSSDCRGANSADFAALGNAVGRLLGAPVVRGLGKAESKTADAPAQALRLATIAQALRDAHQAMVDAGDISELPVYVAPVAPDTRSAAEVALAERIAEQDRLIAELLAQREAGTLPVAAPVVSSGKVRK
jgi:hypothetical protein